MSRPEGVDHDHRDADGEVDVGEVEDPGIQLGVAFGPGPSEGQVHAGEHVEHIADGAVEDAVVEVAQRPGEDHREHDLREALASVGGGEAVADDADGGDGDGDEQPRLALAHAEHRPEVEYKAKGQAMRHDRFADPRQVDVFDQRSAMFGLQLPGLFQRGVDVDRLIGEDVERPPLRRQVPGQQHRGHDAEHDHQTPAAPGGVLGSTWRGRLIHDGRWGIQVNPLPRSYWRAASMQYLAQGLISRRALLIGSPVAMQMP